MQTIISATETSDSYVYTIDLDDTAKDENGNPLHVRTWTWGKQRPAGVTVQKHQANILRETQLLAEHEAAKLGIATPANPEPVKRLAAEGVSLADAVALGAAAFAVQDVAADESARQ